MAISFACPINGTKRDNNTVRFVAGFVFFITIAVISLLFAHKTFVAGAITGLLSIDFIIRAFFKPKYSPLATIARGTVSGLKLPKKMVDGASKVFAARIGVAFTVSATILLIAGLNTAATVVLTILLACAGLEAFVGFCLGCFVYSYLPKNVGSFLAREFVK